MLGFSIGINQINSIRIRSTNLARGGTCGICGTGEACPRYEYCGNSLTSGSPASQPWSLPACKCQPPAFLLVAKHMAHMSALHNAEVFLHEQQELLDLIVVTNLIAGTGLSR